MAVKKIRINEDFEMIPYRVSFFFKGYIVPTFIHVEASDENEAIKKATDKIIKKFKIKSIRKQNEEEYAVTVDILDIPATYIVYEDNRVSAKEAAIDQAVYDLDISNVEDVSSGTYRYDGK